MAKKKQGTEKIFVGATKQITVGLTVPGKRTPVFFTFWPNRINTVPADAWGAMKAKTSSDDDQTGAPRPGPVEEYLQTAILWEMTAEQALQIHEGKRPIMSPAGPHAGASTYVPPDPDRGALTAAQKEMESGISSSDPQFSQIDMGEIPTSQIKPPPAPVLG